MRSPRRNEPSVPLEIQEWVTRTTTSSGSGSGHCTFLNSTTFGAVKTTAFAFTSQSFQAYVDGSGSLHLDRARGEAGDKGAHGQQEENQQGERSQQIPGKQRAVVRLKLALEITQTNRNRAHLILLQGDQRPNIIVPD